MEPSPSLSKIEDKIILIRINIINTMDRPLPRCQLDIRVNSCSITSPIRRSLPPPRSELITKVVSAGINTMVMPLIMPGMERGRIMRVSV